MKKQENQVISDKYKIYLSDIVTKNLYIKLSIAIFFLLYFAYSDFVIIHNIQALYTRLLPLGIAVLLFIFQIFTKDKFKTLKVNIYNIFLVSLLVMILAKCIVHLYDGTLASVVAGVILVIFLISFEIKANLIITIAIYFLPVLSLVFILFLFFNVDKDQYVTLSNMYPVVILGFVVNRIQNKLNYRVFKSNFLLNIEKQKTEHLYKEVLVKNEDLNQKNKEITTQKERIIQKTEELQKSNATKDRFFSIIAHDLRSPFNAILGFSNLLAENHKNFDDEKRYEMIKAVNDSANSAFKLLENLLTWSRSQSNKIKYLPEELYLKTLLSEVMYDLQGQASKKNIKILDTILNKELIYADKNMIASILRNLISNAIKFTPKGGKIIIKAKNKKQFIEIAIKDNGIGIEEEKQHKLFDISERTTKEGTDNETGTGLGLIICKEFTEKHGGQIQMESELGKGTTFTVSFPKKDK